VITGFRVAPGGAQEVYGVRPDLTSLAKILAGGLPGGCLAGRADILSFIEPRPGKPKMKHPGTYNANPLSAAAGIAMLTQVVGGEPNNAVNRAGRDLRSGLNALFAKHNWPWIAYGDFSMVKVLANYDGPRPHDETFIPHGGDLQKLDGPKNMKLSHTLRQALLLNGVDWWGFAGMTSSAHTPDIVAKTVAAFAAAIPLVLDGMSRSDRENI